MRAIPSIIVLVMLAFSSLYTHAEEAVLNETITHGLDVDFKVPKNWYLYPRPRAIVLTRDGELLQSASISRFKYGKKLPNIDRALEKTALISELGELYMQSIENDPEVSRLEREAFEPVEHGSLPGFTLKYRFKVANGPWMRGRIFVLTGENYIYQVFYRGTERVYYERGEEGFESFLTSLDILKK
ncbi:hypothetical protein BTA51_05800 [Hahella sp. CCB-MM4]|uniref:hypothetical protein n=1 Tax=Hahella sp. (strain CCB-MM4) TaxID=1926491 RepID=UPI000B9C4CFA|nr:hypothetical protein [Hahella sp. CCB-MM4]OZG74513.1 hypothetical protein BTA51_05800 [Hahella sp. CCB-MM4]